MGRRNRGRMHPAEDDSWGDDSWGGFEASEEEPDEYSADGFRQSGEDEASWQDDWGTDEDSPFRNRRRRRSKHLRRFMPLLPGLLLVLLAAGLVLLVIVNWPVIRLFLRCMLTGAILGAALFAVLSLRSFHFGLHVIVGGAVFGMIVSCVLKYNILGVNTELGEIFSAFLPCLILLWGIYLCIKSIFR